MEVKKIKLPFKVKEAILALGAQTKNTLSFARGGSLYMSPLHQDLINPKDFLSFKKDANLFLKKHPQIIAYDLHPEYQSTKYAHELSAKTYQFAAIQHHHAHIASCMLENGLKNQKVIGVAFDGTGLGTENKIWGAEFLICDYRKFMRCAYLREIPLLGGQKAIQEPWRIAAAWLYLIYKDKFLNLGINFTKGIDKKKWRVAKSLLLSGYNSPSASSMGRLFDAAASLILAKYEAGFEADLAIRLEKLAAKYRNKTSGYAFKIIRNQNEYILDPLPMFKEITLNLKSGEPLEKIAYCFHLTTAQMIKKVCSLLRRQNKINRVVLSGGVFQNNILLRLSLDLLYKDGFKVFTHQSLSSNDSSISLGQAAIANFL
ncbi:MAG: hypothetical protein PHT41_03920 [Candidatus Omnitrophica bacterium]|nr:hypothetical protein [Candidatus Omnitrophota bacterium]